MTDVLDRLDVDFLEKEIAEFEQLAGEVPGDDEVPDAYNCSGGSCWGQCENQVAKNP